MTLLGPELAAKDPCEVGLRSLHQKVSSPQEGKRDFCFDLDGQVLIWMGKKINLATLRSWLEVAPASKLFNGKKQDGQENQSDGQENQFGNPTKLA